MTTAVRAARRLGIAASLTVFALSSVAALASEPIAATAATAAPVPANRSAEPRAECPPAQRPKLAGTLNINTASARQLQMLPGIGPAKSERIVARRKRHGRFPRIKDLRRVKGIGKKTVDRLRPYLTLDGPNTLRKTP